MTVSATPFRLAVMAAVERGEYTAIQRRDGMWWHRIGRLEHGDQMTGPQLDPLSSSEGRAIRELWKAGLVRLSRAGRPAGRYMVRGMLSTAEGRRWAGGGAKPTHRGTSNGNSRGGSDSRRARKQWLLDTFGDGMIADCALSLPGCTGYLTFETVTVDRIVPGCEGGTYRRGNIQPACRSCNSKHGAELGNNRKKGTSK